MNDDKIFDNPRAFRQQVRMAAVQVAALGDGELAAALAYELEPFSKIPAADAEVAWKETAESNATVKVYDVAVVRRGENGHVRKAGSSRRLDIAVAAILLVAAGAVAIDWWTVKTRNERLHRALAVQMPLDEELRRLDERKRAMHEEIRTIRQKREAAEAAQDRVAAMRCAIPEALGAIATVCGGRIVVKEISSPSPFELEMRAVAVSTENASAIMAQLAETLASRGWHLEPVRLSSNPAAATTEFTCRLKADGIVEL